MRVSQRKIWLLAIAVLMSLLVLSANSVGTAQAAFHTRTQTATKGTIIAQNLRNPRGVLVTDNGTLYVTEAGLGGTEKITDPSFGPSVRGFTGRVSKIAADGTRTTVADGLPSTALGGYEAVGPTGFTKVGNYIYVAVGISNSGYAQRPGDASVLRINVSTGQTSVFANLGAYEFAHNPDGYTLESNPYGVAYATDHNFYVSDAGGNDLYRVNPRTKKLSLVTVFAGLPSSTPNPGRHGKKELDPVPTGITADPSGGVNVIFLSGFPFPSGAAKVVHVTSSGKVFTLVTGLTLGISLAYDFHHRLYVTEFASGYDTAKNEYIPNSGRILRVLPNGKTQVVVDGINEPNGITFDRHGNLYVATNSDIPVAQGAQGQILRFDGIGC